MRSSLRPRNTPSLVPHEAYCWNLFTSFYVLYLDWFFATACENTRSPPAASSLAFATSRTNPAFCIGHAEQAETELPPDELRAATPVKPAELIRHHIFRTDLGFIQGSHGMNLEFKMNAETSAVVMDFAEAALVNGFVLLAG
jgi:hypothetical protein